MAVAIQGADLAPRGRRPTQGTASTPPFPSRPMPLAAADLAMARQKPRSVPAAVAYRLLSIFTRLLGPRRTLAFTLQGSKLLRRFAWELSGSSIGPRFHCATLAMDDAFLRQWIPSGGRVLDVGCGLGRWSREAARHAGHVVGMDLSASDVAKARAMTTQTNVTFVVGDVTRDLAKERFDVALLIHVLEHLDQTRPFLRALGQHVSTLLVEVPDFEADPLNLVRLEMGLPFDSDADHVQEYTDGILRKVLQDGGWDVVEIRKRGGAILAAARPSGAA